MLTLVWLMLLLVAFRLAKAGNLLISDYSHYIRMYIIPEFADLMLQGAQQMDLFNTPILELKEYNISWEERVIKRIADIILAIVLILITSPVCCFG